jgi:hypothetical protein
MVFAHGWLSAAVLPGMAVPAKTSPTVLAWHGPGT